MPRQYSPQFRQRALSLLAEGRSVGQLAAELADAKRRIRELEEELHATKIAASMLQDDAISPKTFPGSEGLGRAGYQHSNRMSGAAGDRSWLPSLARPSHEPTAHPTRQKANKIQDDSRGHI